MGATTSEGTGPGSAPSYTTSDLNKTLTNFVGDPGGGRNGIAGLVPAPASGDAILKKFLSAAGTWETLPGSIFATRTENFSVNHAKVYRNWLGHLVFETSVATNSSGNFNGGGTGNKPICGINGYEDIDIIDFPKIIATTTLRSTPGIGMYFNGIVDLSGTGAGPYVVMVVTNSLVDESGISVIDIYGKTLASASVYDFDITDFITGDFTPSTRTRSRFYVVGNLPGAVGAMTWTFNPMTVDILLGGGAYPRGGTQTIAYPNAKLCHCEDEATLYSTDGGLPKGTLLPSIIAVCGDSATSTRNVTQVTALTFDGIDLLA